LNPERGVLDRKAKSFEEREEEYEKVKRRIFKNREVSFMFNVICLTVL
jgi:encore-like protein